MCCLWKKYLVLFCMFAVGKTAFADEYGIIINKTNGTQDYVRFVDSPKISFSGNDEIVFSTLSASIILRLDEVEDYRFGSVPDGGQSSIKNVTGCGGVEFSVMDSEIIIKNLSSDFRIKVFAMSGIEVMSLDATEDVVKVDISLLNKGVYLLNINSTHTIKFSKQ